MKKLIMVVLLLIGTVFSYEIKSKLFNNPNQAVDFYRQKINREHKGIANWFIMHKLVMEGGYCYCVIYPALPGEKWEPDL